MPLRLCWAGLFSRAKAPESAGATVFLSSSPTALHLSDPALVAVFLEVVSARAVAVACVSPGYTEELFDPQCAHPVSLSASFHVFVDVSTTLWDLLGPHS